MHETGMDRFCPKDTIYHECKYLLQNHRRKHCRQRENKMTSDLTEDNVKRLLESVAALIVKNAEISRLKQEKFNIFSILRKEHDEEKLHSAFIAELLSSDGSHEQGNLFCKLFVEQLGIKGFEVTEKIKVTKEKHLGEEGRMDIYLENTSTPAQIIGIENKIYAVDQPNQLVRYRRYLDEAANPQDAKLIYLTLDGKDASEQSTGQQEVDYSRRSYQDDISNWLTHCHQVAVEYPTLRETIRQYLTLIRKLTNRLSEEMEKEMHDALIKNYDAAKSVCDNFQPALVVHLRKKLNDFAENLQRLLAHNIDGSPSDWETTVDPDLQNSWKGFSFRNVNWPQGVLVKLEGQSKILWQRSALGIWGTGGMDREKFDDVIRPSWLTLEKKLNEGKGLSSPGWPFFVYVLESDEDRKRMITETDFFNTLSDQMAEIALVVHENLTSINK